MTGSTGVWGKAARVVGLCAGLRAALRAGLRAGLCACLCALTACSAGPERGGPEGVAPESVASDFRPDYLGIETHLLDGDLVNFQVEMRGARDRLDVDRYAQCAAAQYTLIRGFGFARHVRTNVVDTGGLWRGDAVYTISSSLPDGVKNLDAEVVAQDCAENGIPLV